MYVKTACHRRLPPSSVRHIVGGAFVVTRATAASSEFVSPAPENRSRVSMWLKIHLCHSVSTGVTDTQYLYTARGTAKKKRWVAKIATMLDSSQRAREKEEGVVECEGMSTN